MKMWPTFCFSGDMHFPPPLPCSCGPKVLVLLLVECWSRDGLLACVFPPPSKIAGQATPNTCEQSRAHAIWHEKTTSFGLSS